MAEIDPHASADAERHGWSPGEDVIEVQRTPAPGAARSAWRTFARDRARAEDDVRRAVVEGTSTIQYPEEKTPVYPRFRGRHKLHRFEDTGLEKCVGCSLCAAACPADCIRVVAAENTPENRVSAGERYAAVYEINLVALHLLRLLRDRLSRSTRSRWATTTSSPTTTAPT